MSGQLDLLPTIREAPYRKESRTSREAAKSVRPTAPQRARVFDALLARQSTMHEVAERLGIPLQSVCGRCSELRDEGLIEDSGETRLTQYGKPAVVWRVKR